MHKLLPVSALLALVFSTCLEAAAPAPAPGTAPPANAKPGQEWKCPKDGSTMVFVPAGKFKMGGKSGGAPEHEQSVKAFWIDKYEVTNAQFSKFVKESGYTPEVLFWHPAASATSANLPAIGMSWRDACAYAKWAGKRLPTEVEWERAARGTDGRQYPWGDTWNATFAVVGKVNARDVEPVGTHPKDVSPVGCYDMAGNASEWCLDPFDNNAYQFYIDGKNPVDRLIYANSTRGGGPSATEEQAKTWSRGWATAGYGRCGFRCAIGPEPKYDQSDVTLACEENPTPHVYHTPTPPKSVKAGDVWICPKNNMEMVYVPGGKALLRSDITPAQTPPFWIARHPVTVAQYKEFMKAAKYEQPEAEALAGIRGYEFHPVTGVAFEDAEAYAKWVGQRLPRPDEFQVASGGPKGYNFPWGNRWAGGGMTRFDFPTDTAMPVASYPAGRSPYGVYDMCSESYEWVDNRANPPKTAASGKPEVGGMLVSARWRKEKEDEAVYIGQWFEGVFRQGGKCRSAIYSNEAFRCAFTAE